MELLDFFSWEELEQIYKKAQSVELEDLQNAARQLFPDRGEDLVADLYVRSGGGRAFRQEDGSYLKPEWTIGGRMLREIGVFADGSVRHY